MKANYYYVSVKHFDNKSLTTTYKMRALNPNRAAYKTLDKLKKEKPGDWQRWFVFRIEHEIPKDKEDRYRLAKAKEGAKLGAKKRTEEWIERYDGLTRLPKE
jgi:hypothetical protein